MRWTEGYVHLAMRKVLRQNGWTLVAGEYPGGSDHELYPLNVVDPEVARDNSPNPRGHSKGELIPDLVAVRESTLAICEAKPAYSKSDQDKLQLLLGPLRFRLLQALDKFWIDRGFAQFAPAKTFNLAPVLVFPAIKKSPKPAEGFSHLRVSTLREGYFEGMLAGG